MKIDRLYVTGYKNIVDCEIDPDKLHVITGCNGTGKSNLLDSVRFVSTLMKGDEARRNELFEGIDISGTPWMPIAESKKSPKFIPFRFEISVTIEVDNKTWSLDYSLQLHGPSKKRGDAWWGSKGIASEVVYIKEMGKTGAKRKILDRNEDNIVSIAFESNQRKRGSFNVKSTMSALYAIDMREADNFCTSFPVLCSFYNAMFSSVLVKLDPDWIVADSFSETQKSMTIEPWTSITHFSLYKSIEEIRDDPVKYDKYKYWLKVLCNIDDVELHDKDKEINFQLVIVLYKNMRLLPVQLSTGMAMMMGFVTGLFSFLDNQGIILFEEPETYLHPSAVVDMVKLLREASETRPVLISTHSPVLLNCFNPKEVSVMIQNKHGQTTAKNVSDIKDAVDTLKRGYYDFGDLLERNFLVE